MFAKSVVVSLALVAAAAPAFSAPLPSNEELQMRELEARLSLPSGAVADLIKSLGKGLLSGGAVTGLLSLLGDSSDNSTSSSSRRDVDILEARAGLSSLLEGLLGAGEDTIESVLKKAVIGGVASGVGAEAVNSATGSSRRASIPASIVEDGAEAAEKGISSIIGNGLADGVGSAVGGLGIGALLSKLFGSSSDSSSSSSSKRALSDLSDDEVNQVLELIGQLHPVSQKRAISSSVGKGIAGLVAGLAATQGTESIIDEIKKLVRKDVSYNELD